MSSQTTRWVGAVAVIAVVAVGVIVWSVVQRRRPEPPATPAGQQDALVMGVVQTALFTEARRAISAHCGEFLEQPAVLDLQLECETTATGVRLNKARVVGLADGGAVEPAFVTCVSEALAEVDNHTTGVRNPADGGMLRLPEGLAYDLDVVLDVVRSDASGYVP